MCAMIGVNRDTARIAESGAAQKSREFERLASGIELVYNGYRSVTNALGGEWKNRLQRRDERELRVSSLCGQPDIAIRIQR